MQNKADIITMASITILMAAVKTHQRSCDTQKQTM